VRSKTDVSRWLQWMIVAGTDWEFERQRRIRIAKLLADPHVAGRTRVHDVEL
jgi:hypothetical protein